jgi:acetyl-CoA carboxylase biotin carboxyl carrier protein
VRVHERSATAALRTVAGPEQIGQIGQIELTSPAPGLFRIAVAIGDVVRPGTILGELEVLGQLVAIAAPADARGAVVAVCDRTAARPAVDHGGMLVRLDPSATIAASSQERAAAAAAAQGLVFRAPTSGRFYGRPAPDRPAFVTAGTELSAGSTICLLEVMKAFHRVTYGGDALPERARVTGVLVAEGADVNAGDPLLALESL